MSTMISPSEHAAGRSALRILVVEDNLDSLHLLCELLMTLGHAAQGVEAAEQAWQELQQQPFDVLFTDVSLPGISGIELAHQCLLQQPALQVIIASGYGAQIGKTMKERVASDVFFLPKPYDLDQLQGILNTICTQQQDRV